MDTTPSLLEIQRAWRVGVAEGDYTAAAPHLIVDAIAPERRLAIYRGTAASTLRGALQLAYPAVRKLVGDEFFDGTVHAYLENHWAATTWLDEYGFFFPDFLRTFAPVHAHPALCAYLPDVATLERAVNHALHAPDAAPLDLRALAALSPEDLDRVRLEPQPSIGFILAETPADAIWNAVLAEDDDAMGEIDLREGPVHLLVEWRSASGSGRDADSGNPGDATGLHLERMDAAEWRFARALCGGIALRDALADSAAHDPGFAAEAALARHLAAGRSSGFRIAS